MKVRALRISVLSEGRSGRFEEAGGGSESNKCPRESICSEGYHRKK